MSEIKKKQEINSEQQMQYLLSNLAEIYGSDGSISLRSLAIEFDMTLLKVRKLLITANAYSSEISDEVNGLHKSGKSIEEIMEETGLSRASVHSYLPYNKGIYNMKELSRDAARCRAYRERKAIVEALEEAMVDSSSEMALDMLWAAVIAFENYTFSTIKGLTFRYTVRRKNGMIGNEIFVNRKEKSITKSSVNIAFKKALELDVVAGPKQLGVFGASYLYPMFIRFGIIKNGKGMEQKKER